ncbi:hypothetical protein JCGZ_19690 [Jatropha curcas]|uniref:Uncharacterized protein n=1 Tax=Jatropha curcas TaxID=180498 RepID=A0A067LK26_JATCU|nr:hypothetical protein JCGZ_19690 [Jatropha curcas]
MSRHHCKSAPPASISGGPIASSTRSFNPVRVKSQILQENNILFGGSPWVCETVTVIWILITVSRVNGRSAPPCAPTVTVTVNHMLASLLGAPNNLDLIAARRGASCCERLMI